MILTGGQDPQIPPPGNCTCAIVDPEFAVDITGVYLDRVQREVKPGGDFLLCQPLSDENIFETILL